MSGSIPVTVVVLCHNEAINLPRCLAAVESCHERVVLDDGSTDDSAAVARRCGARVLVHPFTSFADQRNWSMDEAGLANPWVLHLDADEVATPELLEEVRVFVASARETSVGFIARKVMLDEAWLRFSAGYPVYVPRVVHVGGPRYFMRGHGEWIDAEGAARRCLKAPLLHYNFSHGWDDWWARHRRYADAEARRIAAGMPPLRAGDLFSRDPTSRRAAMRGLSYRLPARPVIRFLYSYLLRLGFLDGRAGWRYCRAMMGYEALIDRQLRTLCANR